MPADLTANTFEPPQPTDVRMRKLADCIRALSMDAVQHAKSGHAGMPMGMADVATVLFSEFLKFDPLKPSWPDRDRFVISNGHGCMLLYSLLFLTGYDGISIDDIKKFRQIGSKTAGHPEYWHIPGIETTTGPLGQGLANSVGFALAERLLNASFTDDLVDHHTYVFIGDGCLMEGISHEAISLAGHLGLGKLIAFFDDNSVTIDGPTNLSVSDDQAARFRASNWHVQEIDGHDSDAIRAAIKNAHDAKDRPSLISCKTIIGFGFPTISGTRKAHSDAPGEDEIAGARKKLEWDLPPFEIPDHLLRKWRSIGAKSRRRRADWEDQLANTPIPVRMEFERRQAGVLPSEWRSAISRAKVELHALEEDVATRKASGIVLEHLTASIPEMIGGSADLTPSNNVKTKVQKEVVPHDFSAKYIHYGVREHGMAATMNGIALHGGFRPYGGTFLTFSDYCRPAIRLAAMMKTRTIFVMTHDSIGLGEDGPTHQPVEHLSALRAMPNLAVFRPGDAIETAECWEAMIERSEGPSLIALSRQAIPRLRIDQRGPNRSLLGGYTLLEADGDKPKVVLLAAGSELQLAVAARKTLEEEGVPTSVVSMPCRYLFDRQPHEYRQAVLGNGAIRIAIEAGVRDSWERYLGDAGYFVGMESFGASGKAEDVFAAFGITVTEVVEMAWRALSTPSLPCERRS
ncbi:transketolase [Rhizobium leguminosarum]|uniref:transketolase n=1 Tax=Rhizobium ruizarguesonis TaxID=2081791 RepID=UPI0013DF287C|nr:transketolase [Rhizobium ruizarguesonis]NEJ88379.1 transketolase [Rhizobium ruizarguesonis]